MTRPLMVVLALSTVTGCGSGGGDPRANATLPPDAGSCNDLPVIDADPGIVLGSHWASNQHSWGSSVTVYACADPHGHGWVRLIPSGTGVAVLPDRRRIDGGSTGVYPFHVTVNEGASGPLVLQVYQPDGEKSAELRGPVIAADGEGWHFVESR